MPLERNVLVREEICETDETGKVKLDRQGRRTVTAIRKRYRDGSVVEVPVKDGEEVNDG